MMATAVVVMAMAIIVTVAVVVAMTIVVAIVVIVVSVLFYGVEIVFKRRFAAFFVNFVKPLQKTVERIV